LIALTELLKLQKSGQFPYEPVRIKVHLASHQKGKKKTTSRVPNKHTRELEGA
jgi:hypothetical protein